MSDTIKRKVFFSRINGSIAFFDWAVVSSINGDMIEPFVFQQFNTEDALFEVGDAANTITDMVEIDLNTIACLPPFADEVLQWHGGALRTKNY